MCKKCQNTYFLPYDFLFFANRHHVVTVETIEKNSEKLREKNEKMKEDV